MPPIISIITPTFNRADTLQIAIDSVLLQGIPYLEHIIIDGNSTDNTRDIIAKYPEVGFYCEPDEGLYFALNKGIKMAQGKYIVWLNSDDYLIPGCLPSLVEIMDRNSELMAIFASAEIAPIKPGGKPILIPSIKKNQLFQRITKDAFSFNAGLFRREIFAELGGFDTRYQVDADRDFLFRFGLAGMKFSNLDKVIYVYQAHPTSLTFGKQFETRLKANLEEMHMSMEYFNKVSVFPFKSELCRNWHTRASVDAAIILLLNGKILRASKISLEGIRFDNNWVFTFTKLFTLALSRIFIPSNIRARFSCYRHHFTGVD